MYFFLANLSFLEVCYTTVTIPQMLINLASSHKTISFWGCALQMYLFLGFGMAECVFLGVMAYDRYTAICHPLRYGTIMSQALCVKMATAAWTSGFFNSMVVNASVLWLPFCGPNQINHYFCEVPAVVRLACGDTSLNQTVVFIFSVLVLLAPFLLILVSYVRIIATILGTRSSQGRRKTFATCGSHLTMVAMYYGTGMAMYMRRKSKRSGDQDKMLSIFYTVIVPLLNPVIYSLRNKEIIGAVRKIFGRKVSSQA
uniref:Olfactory receptor n=1 Tax=Sphenodon punctatus TaxID=8508 RepID=A0A8D0GR05_SPHPU